MLIINPTKQAAINTSQSTTTPSSQPPKSQRKSSRKTNLIFMLSSLLLTFSRPSRCASAAFTSTSTNYAWNIASTSTSTSTTSGTASRYINTYRKGRRVFSKRDDDYSSPASSSWLDKNERFDNRAGDYNTQESSSRKPRRRGRSGEGWEQDGGGGDDGDTFRENFRGTRVFVQNLPVDVTWQEVKDHFKIAGEVVFASVSINNEGTSKQCGVVQYETVAGAKNAIKIMRDHPFEGFSSTSPLYVREDRQERNDGRNNNDSDDYYSGGRMNNNNNQRERRGGGSDPRMAGKLRPQWKCANDEVTLDKSTQDQVVQCIRSRDAARRRRDYESGDQLREELKNSYGVHLDDRLKLWWTAEAGGAPSKLVDLKGEGNWSGPKPWRQIPTTVENDACVDADLVEGLLKQRDVARREKDFKTADSLLEEARDAPDGELYLRIHDESRTWRIWTDRPPPRSADYQSSSSSERPRGRDSGREDGNDNKFQNAVDQCISLVTKYDPEKIDEVKNLLEKFPGKEYNILKKLKQRYSENIE